MKRYVLILLFMNLFLSAQELEFSGYYENQLFPQEIKGKVKLTDYNKIRLDLFSTVSENVDFSADFIYRTYHGATSFNILDFIPAETVADYSSEMGVVPDSLRYLFEFQNKDENFLDNAYVTIYMDNFNVRVGKQQLTWGSGYTWNPTDIFHDKNMIDPAYEKTGVNALKLEVPFSDEGMITGVIGYADEWKYTTKALKLREVFSGFDLSVSFAEKYESGFDYVTFTSVVERRRSIGLSFSTQLFGLGLWGEGAYNMMDNSQNYGQYLIGLDYTFDNGLYVISEFYRNEKGKRNKNDYQFNDWMRLFGSQGENLGYNYIFLGQSIPLTELWNWSNYGIINLSDGSLMFFPWFDYSLNDNSELNFVGYIPLGKGNTEFGEFGVGGFARIRVYF